MLLSRISFMFSEACSDVSLILSGKPCFTGWRDNLNSVRNSVADFVRGSESITLPESEKCSSCHHEREVVVLPVLDSPDGWHILEFCVNCAHRTPISPLFGSKAELAEHTRNHPHG